jgi:translocation and assembly module TamB
LTGKNKFQFLGEVQQFDPSKWMTAPKGSIGGKVNVSGYLSPNIQLSVLAPEILGELDGKAISGNVNLFWQQDKFLDIRQLLFNIAGNKFLLEGKLGSENDILMLKVDAPHLGIISSFIKQKISGALQLDAKFKGGFDSLSGLISLQAQDITVDGKTSIGKIDGSFDFNSGNTGTVKGDLLVLNVKRKENYLEKNNTSNENNFIEKIHLQVNGNNNEHILDGKMFLKNKENISFSAQGGIDLKNGIDSTWQGSLLTLVASGLNKANEVNMQLQSPTLISVNKKKVQVGSAQLLGSLGKIELDQFIWSPGNTQTKGKISQLQVLGLLPLFEAQKLLDGNLKLNANWDLKFQEVVKGDIHIQRESGDVFLLDNEVSGQLIPLGIDQINVDILFGGDITGLDYEVARAVITTNGTRLGQWNADVETQLSYVNGVWQLNNDSPIKGSVNAKIPDLQWLGSFIHPEFALKGKLDLNMTIAGKLHKPTYQAQVEGRDLELAFASEGLLFPNGILSAQVSDETIKLNQLSFTNTITTMPKHEQFQSLSWLGQVGELHASGEVNFIKQSGEIALQWKKFPLLQRKDRWLVTSGQANIKQLNNTWSLIGKMKADGAYFQLPKLPPPSLSSDVVIVKGNRLSLEVDQAEQVQKGVNTSLDISLDLGPNFVFVGRGINTPLTGSLRLKGHDNAPIYASGSILTKGGLYEGYGQQLEIERGILNFQGSPSNPSLNIRALRKGLQVEAGVDVTGTVSKPQVRLVSEPNVPDNEKISWLVLGRETDQVTTMDASLLITAAGAIFGGDGSRNIPKEFAQKLGFDEFTIGPSESAGSSKLPSQTVAGATSVGSSSNEQVVKGSMRLKPGIILSIESGVSDASGALKLSWLLSRRLRLVGRYGTDRAIDAKYTFSFN